ncbi:MAG: metallophosphoesterase, partial [Proteobacteria bacterium]|nr:metallophosphoesterase [Pseudomonadota bacterium]
KGINFPSDLPHSSFTVFARICPHTTGGGGTGRIFDVRGSVVNATGGFIFFTDGTSSLGAQIIAANGTVLCQQRGASNQITLNSWNNVFCEWDAGITNKKTRIFNGASEITYGTDGTTTSLPGTTAADSPYLGNNYGLDRAFDGLIGVVYIWQRLLSSAEKAVVNSNPEWVLSEHNATLRLGAISDSHYNTSDSGTQSCSKALDFIGDFASRMSTFKPHIVTVNGDLISNVADAATAKLRIRSVLTALQGLNLINLLIIGNHEFDDLTRDDIIAERTSEYNYFESGKLYGAREQGNMKFIVIDDEYNAGVSGYPHIENSDGAGTVAIVPDGTNGSDNESGWISSELEDIKPTVVLLHRDLSGVSLTGNSYFSAAETFVRISNSASIRGILESSNVVCVIEGHQHWFRVKIVNGMPYIIIPSLVDMVMRPDGSDKGQWVELLFCQGYVVARYFTDDSIAGITMAREILMPIPTVVV